jgi:ribokinase
VVYQGANYLPNVANPVDDLLSGIYHRDTFEPPEIRPATHLLVQNEIHPQATAEIMKLAFSRGVTVIFNPSPLPDAVEEVPWHCVDWLVLNETELLGLYAMFAAKGLLKQEVDLAGMCDPEDIWAEVSDIKTMIESLLGSGRFASKANIICNMGLKGMCCRRAGDPRVEYWEGLEKLRGNIVDPDGMEDCFIVYVVAGLMEYHGRPLDRNAVIDLTTTATFVRRLGSLQGQ